jgi:hypothetical protein
MKNLKKFDDHESIDEAQVQVAGKSKPSGALVLAKLMAEAMQEQGYLREMNDDEYALMRKLMENVIMDTTF